MPLAGQHKRQKKAGRRCGYALSASLVICGTKVYQSPRQPLLIEKSLKLTGANKSILLKTLRAVIGTLDPTLQDVSLSRDLKDTFIIRRGGTEIIIQEGKLLNREILSSGTAEGIDVAMFLAAMATKESSFYYCDEHFSYIQSNIEKRIFGIMLDRIGDDEQLIFTTHNTDMLDLNLPKHSYVFLRKHLEEGVYQVSAVSASDVLKRNTDSLRCVVENGHLCESQV